MASIRDLFRSIGLVTLIGLLLSILCLLLFATLAAGIQSQGRLVTFDMALAADLHSRMIHQPGAVQAWQFISLFGYQLLYGMALGVAVLLAYRRQGPVLLLWLVTILGGILLNALLKQWFTRPRPFFADPVAAARFYSFPSGHAMLALIGYGMVAYWLCASLRQPLARIVIVFAAVMLISLIGLSRLYLGVHYFSDVIGGFSAGAVWLGACITAMRLVQRRAPVIRP